MLDFRNVEGNGALPVEQWGFEGTLSVLERGGLPEWHKLYSGLKTDTTGVVRANLTEAIACTDGGDLGEGIASLFADWIES